MTKPRIKITTSAVILSAFCRTYCRLTWQPHCTGWLMQGVMFYKGGVPEQGRPPSTGLTSILNDFLLNKPGFHWRYLLEVWPCKYSFRCPWYQVWKFIDLMGVMRNDCCIFAKFRYSEKAINIGPIFHCFFDNPLQRLIISGRCAKFLWPSQNIWTLTQSASFWSLEFQFWIFTIFLISLWNILSYQEKNTNK